jgi:hypothetical protein
MKKILGIEDEASANNNYFGIQLPSFGGSGVMA